MTRPPFRAGSPTPCAGTLAVPGIATGTDGAKRLQARDEVVVSGEQERKAARFRALHEAEPFVIPNPWDAGSARVLEALGFQALATPSSGVAFPLGRVDGGATLHELVEHVRVLDRSTSLPVSVDLENGH